MAAEHLFEVSSAQLARLRIADLLPFASPLLSLIEQVRRAGVSVNEYGVEYETPRTKAPRVLDACAAPFGTDGGQVMLMLQERSMAQLLERQLSHRSAARSVSGMAAMLAHEIKNPLSGIRGAAQLLQSEQDDDGRALTQLICAETDRITELVNRMEDFTLGSAAQKAPVNIHSVLSHVRQLAETGFARHVRVSEHYDPSLPPVFGNRDQLVQVVLNLVKNAAEAIGKDRTDGRISLATAFCPGVHLSVPGVPRARSMSLLITITDNGGGIPHDMREQIFEPFVTSKPGGNGLGLALVAKIIHDHTGIVECAPVAASPGMPGHGAPRKGTQFRLLLPIADKRSSQGAQRNGGGQAAGADADGSETVSAETGGSETGGRR
ncbi:MAG: ATP-binding protein [Pseudomonadota bacterium]